MLFVTNRSFGTSHCKIPAIINNRDLGYGFRKVEKVIRKLTLIAIIVLIASAFIATAINASSSVAVFTLYCDGFRGDGVDFTTTFDRDNTGTGKEAYLQQVTDGAGNVLWSDSGTVPLGTYFEPDTFVPYTAAPQYNPLTITLISLAGNGYEEQIMTKQTGSCEGLPTYVPLEPICLAIPDGSVVGALPSATQAYYAPGNIAPEVVLNPGTYWVLGEDESGQYYKIILACQYLWVPVDSMQPSYQAPWSGQPLPTTVVD